NSMALSELDLNLPLPRTVILAASWYCNWILHYEEFEDAPLDWKFEYLAGNQYTKNDESACRSKIADVFICGAAGLRCDLRHELFCSRFFAAFLSLSRQAVEIQTGLSVLL